MAPSAAVNFEFSDEQELLRDSVRRFLSERASVSGHVRPMLDDERGTTDDVWQGLIDLGVLGLVADNEVITAGVVIEEAGRALLPAPFLGSSVGAVTAVGRSTTDDDHALVKDITTGARIGALAIHEPGRRYDWSAPTVRATAVDGGWQLDGAKCAVLGLPAADAVVVSARTDDELALFVCEGDDLAGACQVDESIDGTRRTGSLDLDAVPARRVEDIDATASLARAVDLLCVALAVDAVGAASAVLEHTIDYAKERKQFGVPIGSFQAVQHLCADMLRDVEMARVAAYYALWACQSADDTERHRAATMAKALASDVLPGVGESAIQVFGGVGFTWEQDTHLFYKRLLSMASLFGNADHHYAELARLTFPA